MKKWLTPQLQHKKYKYIPSQSPLFKGRGELHNLLFYLLCGGCILSLFHLFTFSPLPFGEVRRGCKKLKPFYLSLLPPSFHPFTLLLFHPFTFKSALSPFHFSTFNRLFPLFLSLYLARIFTFAAQTIIPATPNPNIIKTTQRWKNIPRKTC